MACGASPAFCAANYETAAVGITAVRLPAPFGAPGTLFEAVGGESVSMELKALNAEPLLPLQFLRT